MTGSLRSWVLFALCAVLSRVALAGCPVFLAESRLTVGNQPTWVAIGDVNTDGKMDLAVTNGTSNTVSIRLGNGTGGFTQSGSYATGIPGPGGQSGPQPFSVTIDDLNADGRPDLAIAVYSTTAGKSFAVVMIGAGDGMFAQGVPYDAGGFVIDVKTADLNRDGKRDIVAANLEGRSISVLLGNGDGTFAPRTVYLAEAGAVSRVFGVAVADFNNDGNTDVAAANQISNTVGILFGNGDGTLQVATTYPAGTSPLRPAVGDFNRDGKPDLVVANLDGSVSVLINDGNGAFPTLSSRFVGKGALNIGPVTVAVSDLNRDGRSDVALGNAGQNRVSVLLGTGASTPGAPLLGGPVEYPVGSFPTGIAAGDLDGDGRNEIVVANEGFSTLVGNTVSVLFNVCACTPNANFATADQYSSGSSGTGIVSATADFNGDGLADLALGGSSATSVAVVLGAAGGGFQPPIQVGAVAQARDIAVADVNRDGIADMAVTNGANATIFLGVGDGTFAPGANQNPGSVSVTYAVALHDVNRDGRQDLVVLTNDASFRLSVLLGAGDGTFGAAVKYPAGSSPTLLAMNDFNGDGKVDLGIGDSGTSPGVAILLGDGAGGFVFADGQPLAAGSTPTELITADLNRDGLMDLAVANGSGPAVSVFLGSGSGNIAARLDHAVASNASGLVAADLNGNGILDLGVQTASGNIQTLLGNGDGTFTAGSLFASSTSGVALAKGDFDRDGETDFAVAGGATLFVLRGSTNCPASIVGNKISRAAGVTSTSEVLTVIDAEETPVSVTLNTVPPEITVGAPLGGGIMRLASVGAPCSAALTTHTVTVDGVDGGGATTSSFFTVTITTNLPPSAGTYGSLTGAQSLTPGSDGAVSPVSAASDPEAQPVSYSSVTAPGSFSGTATIDAATGLVSISNAGPPGRHDFTVTVTDTPCSKQATTTFTVEVSATFTEPPQNFQAVAISPTEVRLTWVPVTGGTRYDIERRPNLGALWEPVMRPDGQPIIDTTFVDAGRQSGVTYLYRIRGVAGEFAVGPYTGNEAATTVIFTDDPLVAGVTPAKSVHVTELRIAINAFRAAAGMSAFAFSGSTGSGAVILASHIAELRSAVAGAFSTLYGRTLSVTDPAIVAGQTRIKAAHVQELRSAVK